MLDICTSPAPPKLNRKDNVHFNTNHTVVAFVIIYTTHYVIFIIRLCKCILIHSANGKKKFVKYIDGQHVFNGILNVVYDSFYNRFPSYNCPNKIWDLLDIRSPYDSYVQTTCIRLILLRTHAQCYFCNTVLA